MKKVFAILSLAGIMVACNNNKEKAAADAAKTALDSASSIMNKMADSANNAMKNVMDSAGKMMNNAVDSMKSKVNQ